MHVNKNNKRALGLYNSSGFRIIDKHECPWRPGKGFLAMDDKWFDQYVYEVAVPRSLVPAETLHRAAQREPTALPLWDPMGSVAR